MRKTLLISIIISSLILTNCSTLKSITNKLSDNNTSSNSKANSGQSSTKDNVNSYKISDYYPFKANIKSIFTGVGNEYSYYTSYIDYIKSNRMQLRINNGGSETVKVLENKAGELKIVFSKPEVYYRENLMAKAANSNEILLKEPLIKGTAWVLADGRKRSISNINVNINTALGDFKTIEITTTDAKKNKTLDYYALNTGLIKTVYKACTTEIKSTIKQIINSSPSVNASTKVSNSPLIQKVKFYYPNTDGTTLSFIYKDLSFNTNALTKVAFANAFNTSPNKNLGKLFGPEVKINSLYLSDNKVVYVDFSSNLVSQMNAGSTFETMILQSITNTIGNYYAASKVYITIDNKPYSSGHIVMKKGQAFTVDTKNSTEFKN